MWSQAIYEDYPNIEGVRYRTKMYGEAFSIALYERAEGTIAAYPDFNRALADQALDRVLHTAASDLGYTIV
jgi:hypothetical protein